MPMAALSLPSQGYRNIILSAQPLQSTAFCIKKKNNKTGDGTTYVHPPQNLLLFTVREQCKGGEIQPSLLFKPET